MLQAHIKDSFLKSIHDFNVYANKNMFNILLVTFCLCLLFQKVKNKFWLSVNEFLLYPPFSNLYEIIFDCPLGTFKFRTISI